jgi:hypothetical protein
MTDDDDEAGSASGGFCQDAGDVQVVLVGPGVMDVRWWHLYSAKKQAVKPICTSVLATGSILDSVLGKLGLLAFELVEAGVL